MEIKKEHLLWVLAGLAVAHLGFVMGQVFEAQYQERKRHIQKINVAFNETLIAQAEKISRDIAETENRAHWEMLEWFWLAAFLMFVFCW